MGLLKLIRLNSNYWCLSTNAIGGFTHVWVSGNNWVVPSPNCISSVINKMIGKDFSNIDECGY